MDDMHKPRNLVMGAIAGQGALGVQHAAQALYEAGGKRLLGQSLQAGVQKICTRGALDTITVLAPTLLVEGAAEAAAVAVPSGLRAMTPAASATPVAVDTAPVPASVTVCTHTCLPVIDPRR